MTCSPSSTYIDFVTKLPYDILTAFVSIKEIWLLLVSWNVNLAIREREGERIMEGREDKGGKRKGWRRSRDGERKERPIGR